MCQRGTSWIESSWLWPWRSKDRGSQAAESWATKVRSGSTVQKELEQLFLQFFCLWFRFPSPTALRDSVHFSSLIALLSAFCPCSAQDSASLYPQCPLLWLLLSDHPPAHSVQGGHLTDTGLLLTQPGWHPAQGPTPDQLGGATLRPQDSKHRGVAQGSRHTVLLGRHSQLPWP